jgi:hypothetical protein
MSGIMFIEFGINYIKNNNKFQAKTKWLLDRIIGIQYQTG